MWLVERRVRCLAAMAGLLALAACAPPIRGVAPPAGAWPTPQIQQQEVIPPVPVISLAMPDALTNDPEAQRFQLLRRLVEEGLATIDEATARRTANLGALLPYSAPPPAAGLDRPAPLQEIANQLSRFKYAPKGPDSAVSAERDFLLESLLPLAQGSRAPAARTETGALQLGRRRIDALADLGLVGPDERQREVEAIERGEQALANAPKPPPPPPPQTKKKVHKKKPADGLKPGDVPGGVVPAKTKGPMAVHLLSMASETMTDKAVAALKTEYPELATLEFKAVKTDIPDLGTTYRLLAGPLGKPEAEALCKTMRTKGQSCAVTDF